MCWKTVLVPRELRNLTEHLLHKIRVENSPETSEIGSDEEERDVWVWKRLESM